MDGNGGVKTGEIQLPVVDLAGARLEISKASDGGATFIVGPVFLALPMDEAGKLQITKELTGIQIIPADSISRGGS